MCFFRRRKKKILYPSVYSEWLREFKSRETVLISEEGAELFKSGALTDKKYCIDYFEKELTVFLEKQINCYFREVNRAVSEYVEENNYEYLMLMIRRYHLRYRYLYFFTGLDFLDEKLREHLKKSLDEKLREYYGELIAYFDELAVVSDSMGEVSVNIKRLIEV